MKTPYKTSLPASELPERMREEGAFQPDERVIVTVEPEDAATAALRKGIEEAVAEADRGETVEADDAFFKRIKRRGRERLEQLAQATGRPVPDLVAEAAEEYATRELEEIEKIREGIAKADAGGPFVSHDDAMAYLDAVARGAPTAEQSRKGAAAQEQEIFDEVKAMHRQCGRSPRRGAMLQSKP